MEPVVTPDRADFVDEIADDTFEDLGTMTDETEGASA